MQKGTLSKKFPIAHIVAHAPTAIRDIERNIAYETRQSAPDSPEDIAILNAILCLFACPQRYGETFNGMNLTNSIIADHLYYLNLITSDQREDIKHPKRQHPSMSQHI